MPSDDSLQQIIYFVWPVVRTVLEPVPMQLLAEHVERPVLQVDLRAVVESVAGEVARPLFRQFVHTVLEILLRL